MNMGLPAVELRGITKTFPGVVANSDVDLALHWGEVHCLLGENGAGKSTLMQILAGMCRADSGTVTIDGVLVDVSAPRMALSLGIGMVYQHPTLVPTFTVLENLILGPKAGLRLDRKKAVVALRALSERLRLEVDSEAITGKLTLGRQQQVEIIKTLWSGSRVLILDEPTAMLTPHEVTRLQALLVSLKNQGLAVVFITHKLREAIAVGDRITVLRRGKVAGRLDPMELRAAAPGELRGRIVTMMFGEDAGSWAGVAASRQDQRRSGSSRVLSDDVVLRLDSASVKPGRQEVGVHEVSFSVRTGEIFGIAGVDGNGQRELAEAIAGQRCLEEGRLTLIDTDITHTDVGYRQRLGLRFVTDDRLGEGMVSSLSVSLNLLLKRIGERPYWGRAGRFFPATASRTAEKLIDEFDIRTPTAATHGGALSGGNVQKMVLARELSFQPKVVVYNKPTQGLDAKTTVAIRRRIRRLASEDGVAAVLMSNDLEELLDLCDRIGVMSGGRLVGIVDNSGLGVEERVGALMADSSGEER